MISYMGLLRDAAWERHKDALLRELEKVDFLNRSRLSSLCHYTDFQGLKGIVESGCFWATDCRTLNDATEQKFGSELINKQTGRGKGSVTVSQLLHSGFAEPLLPFDFATEQKLFATCFSERSDILSMWRHYSSSARGFCLEFSAKDLIEQQWILSRSDANTPDFRLDVSLIQILYEETLPEPYEEVVERLIEYVKDGGGRLFASSLLHRLSFKFKHPGFVEEHEWRLAFQVDIDSVLSALRFREGAANIKPYVAVCPQENEVRRLPLKRILFGPTLRNDDAIKEVLSWLLKQHGFSDVEVEPCKIPYRL